MNMKAIMFAGVGLFASMSATAIWVGNDMAEIRAREEAKRAAECAGAQPGGASTTTGSDPALAGSSPQGGQVLDPTTGQPVIDTAAAPSGTSANASCTTGGTGGQGAGAVDPVTGQPVDPAAASSTGFDPNTGQPIADPNAVVDPAATGDPGFSSDAAITSDAAIVPGDPAAAASASGTPGF